MKTAAVALVGVVVAGCIGTQPLATAGPTVAPTLSPVVIYVTPSPGAGTHETATPGTTAAPTTAPTPASTPLPTSTPALTTTPPPTSSAVQDDPVLLTWSSNGYTTAQLLMPVENNGTTWIQVSSYDSDYTIYAPDGSVALTGSFDYAAPVLLAPGATSYLVGEEFGDEFSPDDLARVEASGRYKEVDAPDSELAVSNTTVRKGDFDGIQVTGEVANPGTTAIDEVEVVAIFFDAGGNLLGYARDYVDNLEAGAHKGFTADSEFAEIKLSEIANTLVFASDAFLF